MRDAKEMREIARVNHPLNKYFERTYAPLIIELAESGETICSIDVCKIPFRMSKAEICETLKDYVSSFGYDVSATADHKKIHIRW